MILPFEFFAASSFIPPLLVSSLAYNRRCQHLKLSCVAMGYTDVWCMASVHTLLTTQNRSLSQVLSKAGAQGILLPLLCSSY